MASRPPDSSQPITPPDGSGVTLERSFLRFADFVSGYASHVSLGGMFVPSVAPPPPGTIVDLDFRLDDGYRLFQGVGEVVWVQVKDNEEARTPGAGVRFHALDERGRELILKVLEDHVSVGGGPFELEPPPPGAMRELEGVGLPSVSPTGDDPDTDRISTSALQDADLSAAAAPTDAPVAITEASVEAEIDAAVGDLDFQAGAAASLHAAEHAVPPAEVPSSAGPSVDLVAPPPTTEPDAAPATPELELVETASELELVETVPEIELVEAVQPSSDGELIEALELVEPTAEPPEIELIETGLEEPASAEAPEVSVDPDGSELLEPLVVLEAPVVHEAEVTPSPVSPSPGAADSSLAAEPSERDFLPAERTLVESSSESLFPGVAGDSLDAEPVSLPDLGLSTEALPDIELMEDTAPALDLSEPEKLAASPGVEADARATLPDALVAEAVQFDDSEASFASLVGDDTHPTASLGDEVAGSGSASDLLASDLLASDLLASDLLASDLLASDLLASDPQASDLLASDPQASDLLASDLLAGAALTGAALAGHQAVGGMASAAETVGLDLFAAEAAKPAAEQPVAPPATSPVRPAPAPPVAPDPESVTPESVTPAPITPAVVAPTPEDPAPTVAAKPAASLDAQAIDPVEQAMLEPIDSGGYETTHLDIAAVGRGDTATADVTPPALGSQADAATVTPPRPAVETSVSARQTTVDLSAYAPTPPAAAPPGPAIAQDVPPPSISVPDLPAPSVAAPLSPLTPAAPAAGAAATAAFPVSTPSAPVPAEAMPPSAVADEPAFDRAQYFEASASKRRWPLWLLAVAAVGALAFFGYRWFVGSQGLGSGGKGEGTATVAAASTPAKAASTPAGASAGVSGAEAQGVGNEAATGEGEVPVAAADAVGDPASAASSVEGSEIADAGGGQERLASVPGGASAGLADGRTERAEGRPATDEASSRRAQRPSTPAASIREIVWRETVDTTVVTLIGDGSLGSDRLRVSEMGGESPRVLLRIAGVTEPYRAGREAVDGRHVRAIRTGLHPETRELHIVLDLASPDVRMLAEPIADDDNRIRLTLGR